MKQFVVLNIGVDVGVFISTVQLSRLCSITQFRRTMRRSAKETVRTVIEFLLCSVFIASYL